ncbi:hypothetical protein JW933_03065, partial [candidate division FCPU426 bacterium]|nr:hypothetical protein [candidate division FCPU426 bacterium]
MSCRRNVVVLCLLLLTAPACSQRQPQTDPSVIPLPEAESWVLGDILRNQQEEIFKFVRADETVQNWQDLITVTRLRHSTRPLPAIR